MRLNHDKIAILLICGKGALVNKNWTEQVPKPRIKRSAITLQTPSLTEP